MRTMPGARRLTAALGPALLGAAWVASLLGPLLSPQRALGNRDIAAFHFPLRFAFRELSAFGLPRWNPWLHGGQPLLSNPSYGAFYPPGWLIFAAPPCYAMSLIALLHLAVGFAGAWRLARRLGCGRGAAALAGIGYSGCGAFLSQLSAFTMLLGFAWLPWLLAWADAALRAPGDQRWWRPALLAGGVLGLQLLNGEPAVVFMSGVALLALAASAAGGGRRVQPLLRVLLPFAFGLAVAAVQLVPTLGRLVDSPRSALDPRLAMSWSMPPQRLAEIFLPRFYGDPSRVSEGLFFGGGISDGHYPYVESLYPGLLLAVLGLAALLRGGIPRRAAWALTLGAGVFLAVGRRNPLYAGVRRLVPPLAVLRYPERFAILAVLALVLAGSLGWQRLLDERLLENQPGRPKAASLPLALALAMLAVTASLAAVLLWAPAAASTVLTVAGAPYLSNPAALPYLRGESGAALATAAAVAGLLGLCRWRRMPRQWLSLLAVLLLAADLRHYGQRLVRTVPAAVYQVPPPLAASLLPARDRVFATPEAGTDLSPAKVANQADRTSLYIARVTPYSGLLWRIPYAFDVDYDLMLTHWAQASDEILQHEWLQPERSFRFLGAWNVRTLLTARRIAGQPAAGSDPVLQGLSRLENPHVLPRFRFVPRVTFHPDLTGAVTAARAASWALGREDHVVRPGLPAQTLTYARPPRLLESADEGGRVRLRYRAEAGAFFVAATTFDEGWRAEVDGSPVAVHPTAACQLGVELPPGEHRLLLEYRDPFVPVGGAVSLAALLLGFLAFRRPAEGGR